MPRTIEEILYSVVICPCLTQTKERNDAIVKEALVDIKQELLSRVSEKKIKNSAIFDFIHILLSTYYHRESYDKEWDSNRIRISFVDKKIREDKDKIAKAIVKEVKKVIGEL